MSEPKTAILIGAGNRGKIYASHAEKTPGTFAIVGVAEPIRERRDHIARQHGIAPEHVFDSWEKLLALPRMADGAIIATQDTLHVEPAIKALVEGYHVLLEKPMALSPKACDRMADTAHQTGLTLNICHVLRYTEFFSKIKSILAEGVIGDIYTIYHAENLSYHHMAHSYVRGNWRRSREASPMILAKCCHDLDLIAWFAESEPDYISSSGGLDHFTSKNAPAGAPGRCTDGCPARAECLYHSVDTYLEGIHMKMAAARSGSVFFSLAASLMLRFPGIIGLIPGLSKYSPWTLWPTSTITSDFSKGGIMKALKEGPYGKCVYRCDNDQVDHQETIIRFKNGITAVLKMHGLAAQECRTLRMDGSKGTLRGKYGGGGHIEVQMHDTGKKTIYPARADLLGHAEGDAGIMTNFISVLNGGRGLTSAQDSTLSHLMAFAAHEARIGKRVVRF